MEAALFAVQSGDTSINKAARDHGIPPTTLKDRLSGRVVDGTKPGPLPYLNNEEEAELEAYLVQSSKVGYGRTRRQVKATVENVAVDKGVLRRSHISDGWWRRFLQRHPKLSLRYGDATGHVRMNAMTRENLTHYFDLLKSCIEENGLSNHPERIYNMDESGVPLDPKPPKVIAVKGQKKVRYRCSGNKSQITVLGCCSATGQAMPPFVIFSAKRLNHQWTLGEVPGTRYGLSDSGWTDRDLFNGWLDEHFLVHTVPGRPLLLLVDGHSSHYDPDSIKFAKNHSVIIFCLPPHTTHEAQPLDVSLFGPLKKHWSLECHNFIQSSPGKVITRYNFSQLFAKAWLKACTPQTICSGFRIAGIVPFNPEALLKRLPKDSNNQDGSGTSDDPMPEESANSDADDASSTPLFSDEQEVLFSYRFEEGCNVYEDSEFVRWLCVNHPEVSIPMSAPEPLMDSFEDIEPITPLDYSMVLPVASTPVSGSSNSHFTTTPSNSLGLARSPATSSSGTSPSVLVPETPPSSSSLSLFSSPTVSVPETPPETDSLEHSQSPSVPPVTSPLSRYLQPVVSCTSSKGKGKAKTGHARVLTSAKCLEMMEEKRQAKEKEAAVKEARKEERLRRKLEKDELQKKKKQEQLKKREEKEAAALIKQKRGCRQKQHSAAVENLHSAAVDDSQNLCSAAVGDSQNLRSAAVGDSHNLRSAAVGDSQNLRSATVGDSQNLRSAAVGGSQNCECPFCYRQYGEDADGEDWLRCVCNRWVHEMCIEDVIKVDGKDAFCPFCLNS